MLKIVQSTYTDRAMEKQTKPKQRERRRGNEQPFRTKSRVKTTLWETTSRLGDCGQARKPFVLGKINESGMTRKVIISEKLRPAQLAARKILLRVEVLQGAVIRLDHEGQL